jgi:O-antigen ligase
MLVAFSFAGSRGGFIGLVASFGAAVVYSRRPLRNLVLGVLLIGTLLLVAPTSPLARLLAPQHFDQESTDVRTALFWAGLEMFKQHFLTGIGVGNYKAMIHIYGDPDMALENVAHNTYLETGAELGILGLLVFAAILLFSWLSLRRVRIATRTREGDTRVINTAARGLEAGLLGAMVAICFLSALHVRLLWFVVIFSMCLRPLTLEAMEATTASPQVASP